MVKWISLLSSEQSFWVRILAGAQNKRMGCGAFHDCYFVVFARIRRPEAQSQFYDSKTVAEAGSRALVFCEHMKQNT